MIDNTRQTAKDSTLKLNQSLSYNEVVEYLDSKWSTPLDKTLKRFKAIDKSLGSLAKNLPTILIAGSNGKSLTAHFTAKLLKEEGISAGVLSSPHILSYNERIIIDGEMINNKKFTEVANVVINALEQEKIDANSGEILTAMAIVAFKENTLEVAVLEVQQADKYDPVTLCDTKVVAVTRVTSDQVNLEDPEFNVLVKNFADIAVKNSIVVSADQSKINLQVIQAKALANGAQWAMPIRKLAALPYPFEQLHGRCAALAERAAQIYIENFTNKDNEIIANSLLVKSKGQRGRPSLEAKRNLELHPRRTLEQFWKNCETNALPGRFQILDKEKPTILLDNADNLDAFTNTLLGIRLLHYQKSLKGLVIIIGCENGNMHTPEFLRQLRYFFKKTSGQVIFCPVKKTKDVDETPKKWNVDAITNDLKNAKVKAHSAKNFAEAFDLAKKTVDERYGLIIIAGSKSILAEYWNHKGIKK
jgi:dihydrofolate synthase/folylpolyglutamate synthase